jgi:hypothetical protein
MVLRPIRSRSITSKTAFNQLAGLLQTGPQSAAAIRQLIDRVQPTPGCSQQAKYR